MSAVWLIPYACVGVILEVWSAHANRHDVQITWREIIRDSAVAAVVWPLILALMVWDALGMPVWPK